MTTGIRPLQSGGSGSANKAARDHAIIETVMPGSSGLPVLSLVGGKWTTFRAFAELAADHVFRQLGASRKVSTMHRDYPGAPGKDTRLDMGRRATPRTLCALWTDRPRGRGFLHRRRRCAARALPDFSRREIEWLVLRRSACTLDDLVVRRTDMVLTGRLDPGTLAELAAIQAAVLGHDEPGSQRKLCPCHGRSPHHGACRPRLERMPREHTTRSRHRCRRHRCQGDARRRPRAG